MPIILKDLKDLKNNLLKVNFDDNVIIGKSIFNNKKIYINNINPKNNNTILFYMKEYNKTYYFTR